MPRIHIASIQPPCPTEKSAEQNQLVIDTGFSLLETALKTGAIFCCLPEFFNVFGFDAQDMQGACGNAEELIQKASELAEQYGAYIVLPLYLKDADLFYNRAYLISPDGQIVGSYDKIHPTLGEKNIQCIQPGTELQVFETPYGNVAIIICYDIYFPELSVELSKHNVDIVFFPSLQRSEHEMASEAMLKVRAMDTQAYVVRSSYGTPASASWRPPMMFGQSCVVHPDGTLLANAGHYEGIAFAAHVQLPFDWQRPRCGGMPEMSVQAFINEDRLQ